MNVTAVAIAWVIGVSGAVAVACYVTGSAWPLLGLIFLPNIVNSKKRDEKDNTP